MIDDVSVEKGSDARRAQTRFRSSTCKSDIRPATIPLLRAFTDVLV